MSCSRYLFQAVETKFREFEDNPNGKGVPIRYAFLRSEFSSAARLFGARHSMRAAFTFPAKAFRQIGLRRAKARFCLRDGLFLSRKFTLSAKAAGIRQIGYAFRKARFLDAHLIVKN